jgi:hypothetical protein
MRWCRATRRPSVADSGGGDTETLQTDVMRFLAILAMCLMAVFALVQSIPLQEPPRPPDAPASTDTAAHARAQRRLAGLQERLQELVARTRAAQEDEAHARQALVSSRTELDLATDQAEQARQQRDLVQTELQQLKQELTQARAELDSLERARREKTLSLLEVQRRLRREQGRVDRIDQRVASLPSSPRQLPEKALEEKGRPVPEDTTPAQPGFTLRFASAEALDRLVAAGMVGFYGIAEERAWRLRLDSGKPVFNRETSPRVFHEMAPATVPPRYTRAFSATAGEQALAAVVWGVRLPRGTESEIGSLTRDVEGGELVIGADGRVSVGSDRAHQ